MNGNKLTEGPIMKNMLLFALPMMAGNFLQQIYNIADTLIVGRFIGSGALAAVGLAYTLMTFLTSLIIGLCMGSGALFSKWHGAEQIEEMKADIKLSLIFIGLVTIAITLIVYPGTDVILRLLSVPEDIYALMRSYVRIIFAGIIFTFLYNFFAYLLRSISDSVTPLCFLAATSILNIILDLYFVISLNWGVPGAAIATVFSQGVSGDGIALYTVYKRRDLFKTSQPISWKRLKSIIKNDVFTGMQ